MLEKIEEKDSIGSKAGSGRSRSARIQANTEEVEKRILSHKEYVPKKRPLRLRPQWTSLKSVFVELK